MNYIVEYDVAAAFILCVLLFFFCCRRKFSNKQNNIFLYLLIDVFVAALTSVLSAYTLSHSKHIPVGINYFVNCLYLFAFNTVAALYFLYVMIQTRKENLRMKDKLFAYIPILLEFVLIFSSPLTHGVIYFDRQGQYCHGPVFLALYIISFSMIILSIVEVIRHHKNLSSGQKINTLFFCCIVVPGLLVQLLATNILIATFVFSVHLALIYVSLENPEHYIETDTKTYNQKAFFEILSGYFRNEKPFSIVAFDLQGYDYVNRVMGVENGNTIIVQVAEFLHWNFPRKEIYHLQGTEFALLLPYQDDDIKKIARDIRHEFHHPMFVKDEVEVVMTPHICVLSYPDMCQSVDDVMDAIHYSFEEAAIAGTDEIIYASEASLQKKHRESDITHIIKRAIRNDEFQVYYQPIYSTQKSGFESAEALVRLIDDKLGFISPEEFIPMAEKDGTILAIGDIIFKKVCRFLSSKQAKNLGIHYIEVNLSVVQCMQESLAIQLLEIMGQYGISTDQINLEITETANFDSDEILRKNMNALIQKGITFSMDDYGTGFSTASYLIDLPFKIVKIDKSILWSAMEDERAMVILKHTVDMIKSLDLEIVVEGVENQEMADILTRMGCDYLQGYNFSRPVPEKDYVSFLKDNLSLPDNSDVIKVG